MYIEKNRIELYLYGNEYVHRMIVDPNTSGRFWFELRQDYQDIQLFEIYVKRDGCYFIQNEHVLFEHHDEHHIPIICNYRYDLFYQNEHMILFAFPYQLSAHRYQCYQFQKNVMIIGRSEECDIVYEHEAVSAKHAIIKRTKEGYELSDLQSVNGVYVNGKRCFKKYLKVKDHIQILGLHILIAPDCFFINQPQQCYVSDHFTHYVLRSQSLYKKDCSYTAYKEEIPYFVKKTYKIALPLPQKEKKQIPFIILLGPSITMGISSLSMGCFSFLQMSNTNMNILQSLPTIIMSLSMALGSILWPLLSHHYDKREVKRYEEKRKISYHTYLKNMEKEIYEEMQNYDIYQKSMHLSLRECIQHVLDHEMLYRRLHHPSFLQCRIGINSLEYQIHFEFQEKDYPFLEDELYTAMYSFIYHQYTIPNAAITISLHDENIIYVNGEKRKELMLSLLFQSVMRQTKEDICIIVHMHYEFALRFGLIYLPHIYGENEKKRYLFYEKDYFFEYVRQIQKIEKRHMLCFDFLDTDVSFIQKLERCTWIISGIQKHSFYDEKNVVINCNEEFSYVQYHHKKQMFAFEEADVNRYRNIACILANDITFQHGHHKKESIRFFDMFRCGNVQQLNIWERYQKSNVSQSLKACIGCKENGEPLYLDAHEKCHGPHGLLAGMTGSGKSECLLTYILSLCISYSPQDVNFLLIDYKGGTMAETLKHLPHVSGIITNLHEDMLQRSFLALKSELLRRQNILQNASTTYDKANMNIDDYNLLCEEHKNLKKLAHLFIIADEFAELKMQQNDFMEQLKQSARIGRSLGIHLILATQKPSGIIDDQIWSNAHFHLCMKVQSIQDSQDMLKKEDGAYLKKAGECCFQVGYDEVYEQGKIAWSRCPYIEKEEYEEEGFDEIVILNKDGSTAVKHHVQDSPLHNAVTQYDAALKQICCCAQLHDLNSKPLWQSPLSNHMKARKYNNICIWIDDMAHQKQYPLPLKEHIFHHTYVYGIRDEDKNFFLKTLLYVLLKSLQKTYVYIFDFAQHELCKFQDKKGICDIVLEKETEKIESFFYQMHIEMQKRKQTPNPTPYIIIIHNYVYFHEHYGMFEPALLEYIQIGESLHMYIYITAIQSDSLPYQLLQFSHISIAFHQQNIHEYHHIFSEYECVYPHDVIGSAIIDLHGEALLCQMLETDDEDIHCLEHMDVSMLIPTLPLKIAYDVNNRALYLGKEQRSKQDTYISFDTSCYLMLCNYRFPHSVELYKKQLLQTSKAFCIQNDVIETKDACYGLEEFKTILHSHRIVIWQMPFAYEDHLIYDYLCNIQDDKLRIHFFILRMSEYLQFIAFPWFLSLIMDVTTLWMGKGMNEYRYIFKNEGIPNKELKKNEGLLMEEEECTLIQLWEEEIHG